MVSVSEVGSVVMANTMAARDGERPRKMLAMRGESLRKSFAPVDGDAEMGRVIARAFQLANLTAKEVAFHLGHADQSAVSRWVSGAEPVRLARLWSVRPLRIGIVLALSEASSQDGIVVEHVVKVPAAKAVNS